MVYNQLCCRSLCGIFVPAVYGIIDGSVLVSWLVVFVLWCLFRFVIVILSAMSWQPDLMGREKNPTINNELLGESSDLE